jgi:protein-disulfide isomerase
MNVPDSAVVSGLYDPTQQIARALGARVTPEFFVLDKQRRIAYMGAMDDNLDEPQVKERYLEAAMAAILAGKKVTVAETEPLGCDSKYNRK